MPSRPFEPASAPAIAAAADVNDSEVIVIVRSRRNPQQASEVYSLDSAPPELLARIAASGRRTLPAGQPGYADQPVVRGQSGE